MNTDIETASREQLQEAVRFLLAREEAQIIENGRLQAQVDKLTAIAPELLESYTELKESIEGWRTIFVQCEQYSEMEKPSHADKKQWQHAMGKLNFQESLITSAAMSYVQAVETLKESETT